jgi:transposase-like protein
MEIITGVERRRRWRTEDKLRIVAEAERPGACVLRRGGAAARGEPGAALAVA